MSAVEEITESIGAIREKITEASGAAAKAAQQAEQAIEGAEALGSQAAIEGFGLLKEQLETLTGQIEAIGAAIDEAEGTAQSLAGSP